MGDVDKADEGCGGVDTDAGHGEECLVGGVCGEERVDLGLVDLPGGGEFGDAGGRGGAGLVRGYRSWRVCVPSPRLPG